MRMVKRGFVLLLTIAMLLPLIPGAIADDAPVGVELNLNDHELEETLGGDEDSKETPPALDTDENPPPVSGEDVPPVPSLPPAPIELHLPEVLIIGELSVLCASVPDDATGTLELYVGDELLPVPEFLLAADEEGAEPLPANLLTTIFTPDSEGPFTITAFYTPGTDDIYCENTAEAELFAVEAPAEEDLLVEEEVLGEEELGGMLLAMPMAFAVPKVTPDVLLTVTYKGPINGTIAYDITVLVTLGGVPQSGVPVKFTMNGVYLSLETTGQDTFITNGQGIAQFPYQTKNDLYTTYTFRAEVQETDTLNKTRSNEVTVEGERTEIRTMMLVKDPTKREITAYIKTVNDLPIGANEFVDFTFMNASFADVSGVVIPAPIVAASVGAPAGYAYEAVCNYTAEDYAYGVHANVRESAILTPFYASWRAAQAHIEFSIIEVGAMIATPGTNYGKYSCTIMIHVVGDHIDFDLNRGIWGTISQVVGGNVQPYYVMIGNSGSTPPYIQVILPLTNGSHINLQSFHPGENEYSIHFVDNTGNNTPTVATGRFNVEPQSSSGGYTERATAILKLDKPNASAGATSTDTFTATITLTNPTTQRYTDIPAAPGSTPSSPYTSASLASSEAYSGHVFIRFTWEFGGTTYEADGTLWQRTPPSAAGPSSFVATLQDVANPAPPLPPTNRIGSAKLVSAKLMGYIQYRYNYTYSYYDYDQNETIYSYNNYEYTTREYTSASATWHLDFPSFRVTETQDVDDMSFDFIAFGDRTPVQSMWFRITGADPSHDPFPSSPLANGVWIPLGVSPQGPGQGVYPPLNSDPAKWWISLKPGLHSVEVGYPKDINDNYRADTMLTDIYVHEVPTRLTLDKKSFGSNVLVATVRIDDGLNLVDGGGEGKVPRYGAIRFTMADGTYEDVQFVHDNRNEGTPDNRGTAEWTIPKGVFYVTAQYIPDPKYGPYIKSNKCFWLKQLQLEFHCDPTDENFIYSLWTRIVHYQEVIDTRVITSPPPEGYCVYYLNGTFNLDLPIPFVYQGPGEYGGYTFITETNKLYSAPVGTNFVVARYVGDDYPPSQSAIGYIEGPYPTLWHTGEPLPGEQTTEGTARSGSRKTSSGLILRARPAVPTASVPLFEMPYREHLTVRDEAGELRFYYPLYDEEHELPELVDEDALVLVTDQVYDLYHYTLSLSALTALSQACPEGAFAVYTPQLEARIPFATVTLFKKLDAYLQNAGHSPETVTVTYHFEAMPEDAEYPYCVTMVLTDAYGAELSLDPVLLPEDTVWHAADPLDLGVLAQSPLALEMIPFEE